MHYCQHLTFHTFFKYFPGWWCVVPVPHKNLSGTASGTYIKDTCDIKWADLISCQLWQLLWGLTLGAVLFLELAAAAAHGDAGKVALMTSLSLLTITGITARGHDVTTTTVFLLSRLLGISALCWWLLCCWGAQDDFARKIKIQFSWRV